MLLTDDLFILELEQFPLLLEVSHNLSKTLLQQIDLRLKHLDLLVLLELLLRMFFSRLSLSCQINCNNLVIDFNCSVLLLQIVEFLLLDVCFILESLVLRLDVTLNFRDVLLSFEKGIFAEIFKELSILSVDALLLSLFVFLTLPDDCTMLTQEHLVPVLFIFNFLLLDHLSVFEFLKHLLVF